MTSPQLNDMLILVQHSLKSFLFLIFFLLFAPIFLTACGGGGGGATSTPSVQTTISGTAFDAAIVGGTVTVKDLSGKVLGTATSDADGKFTLNVAEDSLKNGYTVSITGGTMDGAAFTGTLTATYSNTDAKDAANLTPLTSLIDQLAVGLPGNTLLEKRAAAIQQLATLGLLQTTDWNLLTSDHFDLQALALRIQDAGGIQAWLDLIKTDLADGELSVTESRSLFPKAHGGVESASVQSEMFIFPGESAKTTILTNVENATVTLRTAPSWVRVDGKDIIAEPPLGESAGLHSVTIDVSANNVAQGRKIAFDISVLKQTTLAHGFLDQNGGVIENEWRDIAVSAAAGALSQSYEVSYVAGLDQAGDVTLKLVTTPPAASEDVDDFSIVAPSFELIKENYLKESGIAPAARSAAMSASASATANTANGDVCGNSYPDLNGDGFAYSYEWIGKKSMFNNLLGANTPIQSNGGSLPRLLPNANNGYLDFPVSRCASRLVSRHSLINTSLSGEPVLFVHGFINDGSLGGGDDYFVNFPRLIEQLNLDGRTFIPFNFQWRTNARFEDVANELGSAIKLINDRTGKKVHIIAHSYGGLLTRTLLQGQAEYFDISQNKMLRNAEYTKSFMEKRIATVTTVGTPHSGVFSGNNTVIEFDGGTQVFHDGRDDGYGTTVGACGALTCHEAGENWYTLRNKTRNYGIDEKEGQIVFRLANSFWATYPNIPTQQLIGIVPDSVSCDSSSALGECKLSYGIEADTGDGLISLHGQRFLPSLSSLPFSVNISSLNIKEYLLGFDASQFIQQDNLLVDLYAQMKEDGYFSDGSLNVTTLKSSYNKYQAVAYHHMGGNGNLNKTVSKRENYYIGSTVLSRTLSWSNPLLTEVGLQNCTSPNDCNHATWNYVIKMLSENPAGIFMPYVDKVKVNGNIGYSQNVAVAVAARALAQSSESLEGFRVKVFIDGDWLGTAITDVNGDFDIDVDFYPNRTYVLEVYPPESMDTSIAPRAVVLTKMSAATPEETDMRFSRIELTKRTFQQGDLVVQLKDSVTGVSLLGYNMTIGTSTRKLVDNKVVSVVEDANVTLPHGLYTVHITKDGYVGEGKATCMVRQLQNNSCVVTMIPDGYVVDSGLSVVLTWGENPDDLDSHLLKYDTAANLICHTYYRNKSACGAEGQLDLDDTSSYGPETVVMQQVDTNSNYVYAIHHFSGSGSITSTSQAKVTVTLANGTSQTFSAPTSGSGQYWKVFEIRSGRMLPCQAGCISDSLSAPVTAARAAMSRTANHNWQSDIERELLPKK